VVELGDVRLVAMETPGHTPESVSLVVYDTTRDTATPAAVLTGDTLFIGDVGRPDLRAALGWSADTLGNMLFDSLHGKLLTLPDSTLVYPAHGAGSLCGKALSKETVSTIGEQRRANYALQPMTKAAFVDLVTADQPDAPAYFTYDAVLNSRERPTLDQALARELTPITLDQLLDGQKAGAQVLDTRDSSEFAAAHLAGSVNIGLGGQYATWAGTVLDPRKPIMIVANPGAETESALRLGRIGFDEVVGFLDGGLAAASHRPDLIVSTERLSPEVAATRMADASNTPVAIDVRAPGEHREKRIAAAANIPLSSLPKALAEIPRDRPVIVFCAGGYRSSLAASLLQQAGISSVSEIAGGIAAWEAARLPLVRD
jgi:rhodanese-related sulfurtransferase